jgi:transmembrane sensor
MDSHKEVENQAAAYLAQRDSGEWTPANQAHLEQWLTESVAHRVAFLRLEGVWEEARRLKAACAGLTAGVVPLPGEWQHSPFFERDSRAVSADGLEDDSDSVSEPEPLDRWGEEPSAAAQLSSSEASRTSRASRIRDFAIAATVLLAVAGGLYWLAAERWAGDRYTTPIGGFASVPLRDGSHITLNTATQVRVELTPQERHIRLDTGEAFFQVAHDANRPFVVQVGHKRVIAVGTQFSVRRNGDDIRVVVTEGKVRVESDAELPRRPVARSQPTDEQRPGEVFVTPGGIASASDEGIVVEERGLPAAEEDLSWRQGYLTFHDTSLLDAIAEFNRYNAHQIRIDDPAIASIRISGTFRALNYEAFVRVLDDGFAIHARTTANSTTLAR